MEPLKEYVMTVNESKCISIDIMVNKNTIINRHGTIEQLKHRAPLQLNCTGYERSL